MPNDTTKPGNDGDAERTPPRPYSKTPAFQAMHAARYKRQDMIRAIKQATERNLICYVAGQAQMICRDDVLFFVDLLHNVERGAPLDLLLHTPGGDMDAAEKLITMVRNVVGAATLRVIVPDFAKSAGTLMALGADAIVMSDSSELGPIDPQITLADESGYRISYPIQSYLDAFAEHSTALAKDPNNEAARMMLDKFEPARLKLFEAARRRAREFAEAQLKFGMFRTPKAGKSANYTAIASTLLDTARWLSHGQMIGHAEANSIGLEVEYMDPRTEPWASFWQLYCYQRLEVKDKHKIFESDFVSLLFDETP